MSNPDVRSLVAALALALALALMTRSASAQRSSAAPPVRLEISTVPAEVLERAPAPEFLRVMRITAEAPLELDADRRRLRLRATPLGSRRSYRCDHSGHRARGQRKRELAAGEVYEEWIDLREYCSTRTLAMIARGAHVEVAFEGQGRNAWVARTGSGTWKKFEGADFDLEAQPPIGPIEEQALEVRLAPESARSRTALVFRVSVRSQEPVRAFVRNDHFSFLVRRLGRADVRCTVAPVQAAPIPDLFSRISRSRGPRFALDAEYFCDSGFAALGVYDVIPILTLETSGAEQGITGVTGRFEGRPAAIRITGGAYEEQSVREAGGAS